MTPDVLKKVFLLRRMVGMATSDSRDSTEATETVLERMLKTKDNQEFLATSARRYKGTATVVPAQAGTQGGQGDETWTRVSFTGTTPTYSMRRSVYQRSGVKGLAPVTACA